MDDMLHNSDPECYYLFVVLHVFLCEPTSPVLRNARVKVTSGLPTVGGITLVARISICAVSLLARKPFTVGGITLVARVSICAVSLLAHKPFTVGSITLVARVYKYAVSL